ncbi:hypothetical protein EGI22_13765 [Lacihabitans sp. LS3-19]|uniref:hypothetical protein n=1 Tax=Lacihabitans sp. LS3-19 TaxID=2487335 RepID=UPI0020CCCB0D|nr:hypothetical protein [Lacihabitans sp. LS3-19]MCP9768982.1 hypothetical protein [Lacihabitans sp. LS3-19]
MAILAVVLAIGYLVLIVLMCKQESQKRKINFFIAIPICLIISTFFGYFVISNFGLRNPKGCKWCNNIYNEAEFCGVCNKNEEGKILEAKYLA